MRSAALDVLPFPVRRQLRKLGEDIAIARKKRRLTISMMAERMAVSPATYKRVEKGDATVSLGIYAMALFVLGFGMSLGDLVDSGKDDTGLMLEASRLPKRVRLKRQKS